MRPVKLKICGVQTPAEARELVERRVEYIGLNFVPHSPRLISLGTAREIMAVIKSSTTVAALLFQNEQFETVTRYQAELKAPLVQLHGDEDAEYTRALETEVVKAIPVAAEHDTKQIEEFMSEFPAQYFLLDRELQGEGEPLDLMKYKDLFQRHHNLFVAGGLTPDNLEQVLGDVRPLGIDIASGVQTDNRLDLVKLDRVLDIVRNLKA